MRDRPLDLFWCLAGVIILGLRSELHAELCELLFCLWRATKAASGSFNLYLSDRNCAGRAGHPLSARWENERPDRSAAGGEGTKQEHILGLRKHPGGVALRENDERPRILAVAAGDGDAGKARKWGR